MISERLRGIADATKWVDGTDCKIGVTTREAADVIDALVATLEHALEKSEYESDRAIFRAALAMARRK